MTTVRDRMAIFDRRIFRSRIVEALANFGSTQDIRGAFHLQPRELVMPGGEVMSVGISFDCQYVPEIASLALNDPFVVQGYATYRFLRELLPGGDESGLTIIELGEQL